MDIRFLIFISHMTYILTCLYYGLSEEKTDQRGLAYYRSNMNFFILYCLSLCIPFNNIPTSETHILYVLIIWILIADAIFTFTHMLLHTKYLYWLHKQHHSNNPSFSTSTFDSHIVEYLFGNVSTGLIPMLIVPGSDIAQIIWLVGANINTVAGHHMEGPHMVHHKLLKYNYGQGLYLWDRLLGTYVN